jgi:16S rRNA (guanine966-N2)-methyltransferase
MTASASKSATFDARLNRMLHGMAMRIIAGALGGRRLKVPRGRRVRPTADRVKESIFSILGDRFEGARVLDLFAGSGALGLEALSRGAREVDFVESDPIAARALLENIAALGCGERARLVRGSVERALHAAACEFDLVFLDPPYGAGLAAGTVELLGRGAWVSPQGLVVAEHSRRDELPEIAGILARIDRRRYGDTEVSFYTRRQ